MKYLTQLKGEEIPEQYQAVFEEHILKAAAHGITALKILHEWDGRSCLSIVHQGIKITIGKEE